jgi:hypothetical protein
MAPGRVRLSEAFEIGVGVKFSTHSRSWCGPQAMRMGHCSCRGNLIVRTSTAHASRVDSQAQSVSHGEQPPVACPQGSTCRQSDGGEEMRVDISDTEPEERLLTDEMQRFPIRGDAGLGQVLQGTQNEIALSQMTQGSPITNGCASTLPVSSRPTRVSSPMRR